MHGSKIIIVSRGILEALRGCCLCKANGGYWLLTIWRQWFRLMQSNEQEIAMNTLHLITYGCGNEFDKFKFVPVKNADWIKPTGGLWASPVDSEWGWSDWGKCNQYGNFATKFEFVVTGNIFVIDGPDDLSKLPIVTTRFRAAIDFEQLQSEGYDAVHLTARGETSTRWTEPGLYGWDCESVLVMNPECIKPI